MSGQSQSLRYSCAQLRMLRPASPSSPTLSDVSGIGGVQRICWLASGSIAPTVRSMSGIPRLPLDEAKAAADQAGVPDYMAELSIFQVLLNHPRLACALNDLLATMLWRGSLDA